MRTALLIISLALAVPAAGHAASASSSAGRTVPCSEIIDRTTFPYAGGAQPAYRYRLVLGAVSVPPAYLPQVVAVHEDRWSSWSKAGLVVRASAGPLTIEVPAAWRARAAIIWGNGGYGPFSSLRIAGCPSSAREGNAYAGGFYLHARSACVPLIFHVGSRSETVRFGVGRRCP